MKTEKIYPSGFAANTYILTADGKNAVVIDPAQPRIAEILDRKGLKPVYVLLTHAHFDHVGGAAALQKKGAKILCSAKERTLIGTPADLFDAFGAPRAGFDADDTLRDGETRELCSLTVTAIATPGHTAGGMCYLVRDAGGDAALFTGDTLFAGSIGRTDFPTGSMAELKNSLFRLAALEGDYPVYAGHEEDTTLEEERRTNPFMADGRGKERC